MLHRIVASARTVGWICAAALAAVVASERVYWYWSGIDPDSLSVLTTFYAVAVAVTFTAVAAWPGAGLRKAVLGGAVFALVVEGVITPVIYEDGPLPLLYLMFVGWHGLFAFVGFVYLVRRWALTGRSVLLAVAATAAGLLWGTWALSSGVTDRVTALEIAAEGGGSAETLAPGAFAAYAAWTGLSLLAVHLVLDRLWPAPGWSPSRAGKAATAVAATFLTSTLVVPAVPWAPVKLAVLAWILIRLLRRDAGRHGAGDPTLVDELAGSIRSRSLWSLTLLPTAAVTAYAALWPLRGDESLMSGLFHGIIAVQVCAGVLGLGWAVRRRRTPRTAAELNAAMVRPEAIQVD